MFQKQTSDTRGLGAILTYYRVRPLDNKTKEAKALELAFPQEWMAQFARLTKRTLVIVTGHNPLLWHKSDMIWRLDGIKDWFSFSEKEFQAENFSKRKEQLAWDINKGWRYSRLIQYRLHGLTEVEARQLLVEKYEIGDDALVETILRECLETEQWIEFQWGNTEQEAQVTEKIYHADSLVVELGSK